MSVAEEASTVLQRILTAMQLEAEVKWHEDDERITLEVHGQETGLVIGRKGQTLDALQYLVNKIVFKSVSADATKPIQVDAEGYRGRRAESLVELAHRLVERVRKTGRAVAADPMSAAERRIMHMALADVADVTTRSEGEGIYRHLVVLPSRQDVGEERE